MGGCLGIAFVLVGSVMGSIFPGGAVPLVATPEPYSEWLAAVAASFGPHFAATRSASLR